MFCVAYFPETKHCNVYRSVETYNVIPTMRSCNFVLGHNVKIPPLNTNNLIIWLSTHYTQTTNKLIKKLKGEKSITYVLCVHCTYSYRLFAGTLANRILKIYFSDRTHFGNTTPMTCLQVILNDCLRLYWPYSILWFSDNISFVDSKKICT